LDRGLAVLGLGDEPGDLRQGGVRADAGGAYDETATGVDGGTAGDRVRRSRRRVLAAIAISLGTLLRRASAANILLALLVVDGQLIGSALPEDARRYLPPAALQALVTTNPTGETLAPGAGLAVLGATAVAMVALAGRRSSGATRERAPPAGRPRRVHRPRRRPHARRAHP
jgi:hypothetical protein